MACSNPPLGLFFVGWPRRGTAGELDVELSSDRGSHRRCWIVGVACPFAAHVPDSGGVTVGTQKERQLAAFGEPQMLGDCSQA